MSQAQQQLSFYLSKVMDTDYYAEALVQFERRTWREDGRAYYLARLEKRLFELSRDLTIADWKAIRNEH